MPIFRKPYDDSKLARHPCTPLKLMPYPLTNPDEVITDLDPKHLVDFPSQERYPAPQGEKEGDTSCGCLMTTWPDCRADEPQNIKLETIWQPLWDLKDSIKASEVHCKYTGGKDWRAEQRFENWRRRNDDKESISQGYGQMTYPDRYHVWEVEVTYEHPNVLELEGQLTFTIGEKNHLSIPLQSMFRRPTRPCSLVAPLPIPLYIPSVQSYSGTVKWESIPDDYRWRDIGPVRYQLNGYLHRSIP